MSHMSTISTEIRSLAVARLTAKALGIPVLEGKTRVRSYFTPFTAPADLVFDVFPAGPRHEPQRTAEAGYQVGLQKQKDGTYSFIGDHYDMGAAAIPCLKRFGDDFERWEDRTVNGVYGHVNVGRPNRFLQEYALQAGELAARVKGMRATRQKQSNGDVHLKVEGGAIPVGAYVLIVARRDGSSSYSAHGVKGPSCLKVSDWAKSLLGTVTSQKFTAEFYHAEDAQTGEVLHTGTL